MVAPDGRLVRARPGWVCEVVSESNRAQDFVRNLRIYQRASVPHYWVVDPEAGNLTVHRWTSEAYMDPLVAGRDETVQAEPFDAITLETNLLFGAGRAPSG